MDSQNTGQDIQKEAYLGTKKHMKRGLSLFKRGELEQAIRQFELILLHDKRYVRAYNNLGYIYRTLGDYDKALHIWEEGLRIDPSYKRLHENISSLKRFLKSEQQKATVSLIGIEDFQAGVDWLTENAELVEIREGRFFDAHIIEDQGARYVFKMLGRLLSSNRELFQVFERASKGWLRLPACEHVVRARSFETVLGRPFLALDYASDGSLRELLNQSVGGDLKLSLAQIVNFALQVCLGMHFIETQIGVHGDLRLENLLLCKDLDMGGRGKLVSYAVKISDIGQRAIFDKQEFFHDSKGNVIPELAEKGLFKTSSGFLTASLPVCAPELLGTKRTLDILTDIYAFGIAFYEMLTGVRPFSGLSPDEAVREISGRGLEHPTKMKKGIPPAIGSICMRCLESDPGARYKDFAVIAEEIITYMETARSALAELNELCRRYRKVSRFQFKDEESNTSMMIVGGTEFSTHTSQLWEVLKHRARKERDEALMQRLEHIETVLVTPGLSIGEAYPTPAIVAESLMLLDPDKHLYELSGLWHTRTSSRRPDADADEGIGASAHVESPADEVVIANGSRGEVFGSSIAGEYSSLIRQGRLHDADRLLGEALEFRAVMLLGESSKGHDLLTAFKTATRSDLFGTWLRELFRELSPTRSVPYPEEFLQHGMSTPAPVIAKISGLLLMMAGEFAAALEAFSMIPGEQYLPALDIYLWAMAKFQSEKMENLRLNSLKNASRFLKEAITGETETEEGGTNSIPSTLHGRDRRDALFLQALVSDQLGEHRRAIAHLQACKKVFDSDPSLSREKLPWVHIISGKCYYDSGLPSEGLMRWQRVLTYELSPPFFDFLELGSAKPLVLLTTYLLKSCEQAVSQFGDKAIPWCMKGKLLNYLALSEDAIECTRRALEVDEDFYPAYYVRMESLISAGRYEEALEAFRVCCLREPYDPLFMLRESEILCRVGEAEKALVELKRAISHGLDLSELRSSVKKERLGDLGKFDEFIAIMADLDRI